MTRTTLLAGIVAGLGLHAAALGAEITVPGDYGTIQDAIAAAASTGDTILVSPGIYTGTLDFDDKSLVLRSTDGPQVTTINALGMGTAITIDMGQGLETVIDGFTITGGTGTDFGSRSGGGALVCFTASATVNNCIFVGNTAGGTFSGDGGAVYCFVSNPHFTNCTFIDNEGIGFNPHGGAMYTEFANPIITNCTMTNNTSTGSSGTGGGVYSRDGSPRFINSIVYGNTPNAFGFGSNGFVIATYSDISGGFAGDGNINANPMFVDAANGDVSLLPGSPCIDRGDSTAIAAGFAKDLAQLPRGVDDPSVLDHGVPVFGLCVDMGAYEYQVAPTADPCPLDLNDNGEIGFGDILVIIQNWGVCPP